MIRTIILTTIATLIITSSIMLTQEIYAPPSLDLDPQSSSSTSKAIPDWVKNQFEWYVNDQIDEQTLLTSMNWMFDNNLMHLSDKAAQEVNELREMNKRLHYGVSTYISDGDIPEDEFESITGIDVESSPTTTAIPNLLDARKSGNESLSNDKPTEEVAFYYNKISFATDTVSDILAKGGTTSAWNEGFLTFSKYDMSDSVADDLQRIVVLCNNAIDKKSQKINAELELIEQWLAIIDKKHSDSTAYGDLTSDRTNTGTEYNAQHSQSDLDFIQRKLSSIDQQINSLMTGIRVMDDKLQTVGDDAQLANTDLQNALQKHQQTLQTMSNVSKELHDTTMNIVRNIG